MRLRCYEPAEHSRFCDNSYQYVESVEEYDIGRTP